MRKLGKNIKGYQLEVFHHLKEIQNIQQDQGIRSLVKIIQFKVFIII